MTDPTDAASIRVPGAAWSQEVAIPDLSPVGTYARARAWLFKLAEAESEIHGLHLTLADTEAELADIRRAFLLSGDVTGSNAEQRAAHLETLLMTHDPAIYDPRDGGPSEHTAWLDLQTEKRNAEIALSLVRLRRDHVERLYKLDLAWLRAGHTDNRPEAMP